MACIRVLEKASFTINPTNTNKGLVDVTHSLVANNAASQKPFESVLPRALHGAWACGGTAHAPRNPAARMAESGGDRETANFNARFRQIDANYPSAAPSTYTAVKGDTLISVARAVWGDGSLWYLIADANGLSSPDSLTDGQSLVIPNKVANINNNVSTFAPYDPSKIIGDTTPATPPPPPPSASNGGDKCGGFGQVLVVIVAVAVTIATGGAPSACPQHVRINLKCFFPKNQLKKVQ